MGNLDNDIEGLKNHIARIEKTHLAEIAGCYNMLAAIEKNIADYSARRDGWTKFKETTELPEIKEGHHFLLRFSQDLPFFQIVSSSKLVSRSWFTMDRAEWKIIPPDQVRQYVPNCSFYGARHEASFAVWVDNGAHYPEDFNVCIGDGRGKWTIPNAMVLKDG